LGLQHAFCAHTQRVDPAAAHVAHEQVLEHLFEIGGARVDQMMFDGAQLHRTLGQGLRRGGVDAAGVDGHGDHRPPIGFFEPGDAERRVETAGKSQEYGLGALP